MSGVADDATEEAVEFGRWLFAQSCSFVTGAALATQLPEISLPEVAFAGRSNVGKSSLINALTGRRTLARTSNTPGRTQQVNFFLLGERLQLVDLPGYGYAKASKTEIKRWNRLIEDYLRGRPSLRRVVLLLDTRRGVSAADEAVMALLDTAAVNYQIVLTKCDKAKPAEREAALDAVGAVMRTHPAAHPAVLATSAREEIGIAALRAAIAALADAT